MHPLVVAGLLIIGATAVHGFGTLARQAGHRTIAGLLVIGDAILFLVAVAFVYGWAWSSTWA